jgi:hypothetical protein
MDKFSSAVKSTNWLWNGNSNPFYAQLNLEDGEEGESRSDEATSTRFSFHQPGLKLSRSAAIVSYLFLSVASLMVSFYLGQYFARNKDQSLHLQSDFLWGKGKSP